MAFDLKQPLQKQMRTQPTLLKTIVLTAATGTLLALSACGSPPSEQDADEYISVETVEEVAPAAEVQPVEEAPVHAETGSDTMGPPVESLPPEVRSSEESVQPDSETLFY